MNEADDYGRGGTNRSWGRQVPITPEMLVEVIHLADDWLEKAAVAVKRDQETHAARALHDGGLVVAAMQAYDNNLRSVHAQLTDFARTIPRTTRASMHQQVYEFVTNHRVYPLIRDYAGSLSQYTLGRGRRPEPARRFRDTLVRIAGTFLATVAIPVRERKDPLAVKIGELQFVRATPGDCAAIQEYGRDVLHRLNPTLLDDASDAYGRMRGQLLEIYRLPDPGWSRPVS